MSKYFNKDFVHLSEQGVCDIFRANGYYPCWYDDKPELLNFECIIGNEYIGVIEINKIDRTVKKYDDPKTKSSLPLTMREFELLHELFQIWGWVE